jgi:hydrogenase maturation factor
LLSDLISRITKPGKEVIIGPAVGEDAFAVGVGRAVVAGTTDPVTFTSEHIGYYAVNVNANDVATMGAEPKWFLATVLVPVGFGGRALRAIFEEIDRTSVGLGARLLGGHTEVTSAVTRPVVVGAMLGLADRRRLVMARRARAGDVVLLTKRLAIEGTSIIARWKAREVAGLLGRRGAAQARDLIFDPGMSIVKEAMAAVKAGPVHAMHDPTEGGLLWGLKELSLATGLGIEVGDVPVFDETRRICERFGLNPLGLIASGSLLIVVPARRARAAASAIHRLGIECAPIGRLGGKQVVFVRRGARRRPPEIAADEMTKLFRGRRGGRGRVPSGRARCE